MILQVSWTNKVSKFCSKTWLISLWGVQRGNLHPCFWRSSPSWAKGTSSKIGKIWSLIWSISWSRLIICRTLKELLKQSKRSARSIGICLGPMTYTQRWTIWLRTYRIILWTICSMQSKHCNSVWQKDQKRERKYLFLLISRIVYFT